MQTGPTRATPMPPTNDLVILHGALGASSQLEPLAVALRPHFRVHLVDFEGHGSAPARTPSFTVASLTQNVIDALEGNRIERAHFFGYSMGGYIAVSLALQHPERVNRIVTLGTKFRWDPATAEREAARLDPAAILAKVPRFAESLRARHQHAGGWERVLARTAEFLRALGSAPALTDERLRQVTAPVKVMVGTKDSTVGVEESAAIAALLPHGRLALLDDVPHPIEQVSSELLAREVREFADTAA